MSESVKFMKIDHSMSKGQWKIFLMFIVLALVLSVTMEMTLFVPIYLAFGSVILSTSPFSLENYNHSAFVNLLPASVRDRVRGRYFYSLVYLGTGLIISELSSVYMIFAGKTEEKTLLLLFPLFITAVSMIFVSIEYVLLYAVGIGKSTQYMKLICMVPGFIMFGTFTGFSDQIMAMAGSAQILNGILLAGIVAGILCYVLAIEISILIVKRRDSI